MKRPATGMRRLGCLPTSSIRKRRIASARRPYITLENKNGNDMFKYSFLNIPILQIG